jgi:hypothetical protein
MVVPRLLSLQVRLHARRISHPDLRYVIDHRVRHVERVVQERPQEPHRDELEGETQPVVITALRHDHVMIRVVQEEEPLTIPCGSSACRGAHLTRSSALAPSWITGLLLLVIR